MNREEFEKEFKNEWESGTNYIYTYDINDGSRDKEWPAVIYDENANVTIWLLSIWECFQYNDFIEKYEKVTVGRASWDELMDYFDEYDCFEEDDEDDYDDYDENDIED